MRQRPPPSSLKTLQHQAGQALMLGLILSLVCVLALMRYFGVGQAAASKTRLLHVADAAAYSGAVVQARALNMLSMLNRTQLAHQVAMAHLVTMGSWAMLGGTQGQQLARGNPPASLLRSFFGAAYSQAYQAARPASGLEDWANISNGQLTQAYAAHETLVHDVLALVQQEILNGLPAARLAAMRHVVNSQYGDGQTQIEVLDDNWPSALQAVSTQQMLPFVQALGDTHDWLSARNDTVRSSGQVQVSCPALHHELRRRGQTRLNDAGVWASIDTQSYHALRANRWIGCYFREYEMGWGWISASKGDTLPVPYTDAPPDNFSAQDFWRWVQANTDWDLLDGRENPLANSRAHVARARWVSRGLPVMMDVKNDASTAAEPTMGFHLRLQRPGGQAQMVQSFTAHAAAQTYFRRPQPRADGRHEHANLFNPYWQARLMEVRP